MSYNIKSKTKNQDNSHLTFWFILGFFVLALSINVIKLTREYYQKRALLSENEQELLELKQSKNELQLKIKQGQSRESIEAEARKMALSKANELIIVVVSPSPKPKINLSPTPGVANYKLWVKVFLGE